MAGESQIQGTGLAKKNLEKYPLNTNKKWEEAHEDRDLTS